MQDQIELEEYHGQGDSYYSCIVLVLLGLSLMVGGIIGDKNGAVVVGICVAAAAALQWIVISKQAR